MRKTLLAFLPLFLFACQRISYPTITLGYQNGFIVNHNDPARPAYAWGLNNYYQLTLTSVGTTPNSIFKLGDGFEWVVPGFNHTCFKKVDDPWVKCAGSNQYGQLGVATNFGVDRGNLARSVMQVSNLQDLDAGDAYTCLIDSGDLYCWGRNYYNQLGIQNVGPSTRNIPTPTHVHTGYEWRNVVTSQYNIPWYDESLNNPIDDGLTFGVAGHTCGITTSDQLYCWGKNTYNQLGPNSTPGVSSALPKLIPNPDPTNLSNVLEVSVTGDSTCALWRHIGDSSNSSNYDYGRVYCWGVNAGGLLGRYNPGLSYLGPHNNFTLGKDKNPVQIRDAQGNPITHVSDLRGSSGTYSVVRQGPNPGLWSWGHNIEGAAGEDNQRNGFSTQPGMSHSDGHGSCNQGLPECCDDPFYRNQYFWRPTCTTDFCSANCSNWRCGDFWQDIFGTWQDDRGSQSSIVHPTQMPVPTGTLQLLLLGGGTSSSAGGVQCGIFSYDSAKPPGGRDGNEDFWRVYCWGPSWDWGAKDSNWCADKTSVLSWNPDNNSYGMALTEPIF